MADEADYPAPGELTSREPSLEDLVELCRTLNANGAKYIVVGGFAIRAAGYARNTSDVDLVISTDAENEGKVFKALESLPDQAVKELDQGDVAKYIVVRVADEITIDLMASAAGIDYAEACHSVDTYDIQGVPIPFASPELLWRMKRHTHREKDIPDLQFLRMWFESAGKLPPP